ncbi:Dehydrodolichyl diphosphate syntase complex subunit Nus1 [Sparassis crispa]|uniref:ditrans,polycis-polyprenyl diphosphate synthase [(2E,6E)-farnesyldiphosphate specific] n=1 Tax=Sparassis crispa TaxID=139825 RepID=A0A401G768_9APHY|nr:Dehydrodolichyl diphosphate syntase complex subunit Nus1 [Sparassis crispa]GBE77997.1 Dehydrodolichyl diphosphate syntase complex subunit Nus1 [Sparassis crispa]
MYDYDGTLSSSASSIRERLSGHFDFPDIAVESDIEFPLTPPSSDDSDSRSNSPDANIIRPRLNVMTLEFAGIGKKKSHVGRPAVKRRRLTRSNSDTKPLTLHIVSRQSGKPTISRAASAILHSQRRRVSPQLSTYDENPGAMQQLLVSLLEGDDGFPSPDLAIVHYITPGRLHLFPMELHGFPPWQMRLTEFYFDGHFCTDVAHLLPGIPGNGPCSPLEEIEFRRALDKFASAEMRLGK